MIKHGKRITETIYDGVMVKTLEDNVSEVFTDQQFLLKEIIEGLGVITSGQTRKLEIEVCLDKRDRYKLTQRWRVQ